MDTASRIYSVQLMAAEHYIYLHNLPEVAAREGVSLEDYLADQFEIWLKSFQPYDDL